MPESPEQVELTDRELYLDDLVEAQLAHLRGDGPKPEADPDDTEAQAFLWIVELLRLSATGRIPDRPPPWESQELARGIRSVGVRSVNVGRSR